MSQTLVCPCGASLPASARSDKKYCGNCLEIRRKQSQNRKNRRTKTILIYKRMFVNLTKNYILFAEGVKK